MAASTACSTHTFLNEEDGALISRHFLEIDVSERWVADATGSYWNTWAVTIRTMGDLRARQSEIDT